MDAMRKFTIEAEGKTLEDVLMAIDEARKRIATGTNTGFDSNEDGNFKYSSEGTYYQSAEELMPDLLVEDLEVLEGGINGFLGNAIDEVILFKDKADLKEKADAAGVGWVLDNFI
jgi:hypothetical protein